MAGREQLAATLRRIDGRGYKAYQDLTGTYAYDGFTLFIDHVQGDPFASPSRMRVRVDQRRAGFPQDFLSPRVRRVALEDFLARRVADVIRRVVRGHRGTGKSGLIAVDGPGQEVLERTAVKAAPEFIELRLSMGLPAAGRTVLGREALAMLDGELPQLVQEGILYANVDQQALREHVYLAEDQELIREQLAARGLVAFVGNGAILPRQSGVSDLPLPAEKAVPFLSPPSLQVIMETRHHGPQSGMGIPEGVVLIAGGGYHGKSTLLRALERGVYRHIAGDGREWVITRPAAVKIRAEDGRRVEKVDISPFINNLPFGHDTTAFTTEDASGSTSQAANIMEALEAGADVLLLDEDTSATNFMIRDVRMQELVSKDKEPITPFIDKVVQLYRQHRVTSILVIGGAGDYLDVADTVMMMDHYRPVDVTSRAGEIARQFPTHRRPEGGQEFGSLPVRVPRGDSFHAWRGRRVKVEARGLRTIVFGEETIILDSVEQLVDPSQTRAVAQAVYHLARQLAARNYSLREALERLEAEIEAKGLDVLAPFPGQHPGDLARPRLLEVAAAVNRMRSLQVEVRR